MAWSFPRVHLGGPGQRVARNNRLHAALWPQLLEVDLFEMVPEVKVPVFLVEGRHDHEVPSSLSSRWFDALVAPSKELIWFEHSAHMPNFEETARFDEIMIARIRPLALSGCRPLPPGTGPGATG